MVERPKEEERSKVNYPMGDAKGIFYGTRSIPISFNFAEPVSCGIIRR